MIFGVVHARKFSPSPIHNEMPRTVYEKNVRSSCDAKICTFAELLIRNSLLPSKSSTNYSYRTSPQSFWWRKWFSHDSRETARIHQSNSYDLRSSNSVDQTSFWSSNGIKAILRFLTRERVRHNFSPRAMTGSCQFDHTSFNTYVQKRMFWCNGKCAEAVIPRPTTI